MNPLRSEADVLWEKGGRGDRSEQQPAYTQAKRDGYQQKDKS